MKYEDESTDTTEMEVDYVRATCFKVVVLVVLL
jgi:hypothetical protein